MLWTSYLLGKVTDMDVCLWFYSITRTGCRNVTDLLQAPQWILYFPSEVSLLLQDVKTGPIAVEQTLMAEYEGDWKGNGFEFIKWWQMYECGARREEATAVTRSLWSSCYTVHLHSSVLLIPRLLPPSSSFTSFYFPSWPSRWEFGRYSVRISAGTLTILTDVCCGSPLSLRTNAGTVPRAFHGCFLPNPFHFSIHHSYHLTLYGVDQINKKYSFAFSSLLFLFLILRNNIKRIENTNTEAKSLKKLLH
jgi:hypothetical protein